MAPICRARQTWAADEADLRHVPELKRLRISSINSIEVDRDLLDVIADDARLMPHLHLSLQSGDDMILKRMKRRHSRPTPSNSARRCGGCGRTSRSAPISSRDFRPRPKRCSRVRRIWSRNAISHSCTCFPTRRARARRPRGCRRSRASDQGTRAAFARDGEAALEAAGVGGRRDAAGADRERQAGADRAFSAGRDRGEMPGAVQALTMTGHDGARLTV